MALTLSTDGRNARLDSLETVVGTDAILKIREGAPPSNVAASSTGTVVSTIQLPTDYMLAASGGSKSKSGTWEDTSADATGTAGHFELCESDGTTVHLRGTVTITGGGGDMTVDSTSFTAGQKFTITTFTLTDANAGS